MVSDPTPRLLASHSQATLRTLRTRAPEAVERVLARLPAEAREGLVDAVRVEFVPAAWDLALVHAIQGVLGGPASRALYRDALLDSLGGPLLGGLLKGALGLFGASPERLFGWAGRGWGHVTASCGELRLEAADATSARLVLEGLPAELAEPLYLEAIAASLEALLTVCKVEGRVEVGAWPGGARFEARWRPRDVSR